MFRKILYRNIFNKKFIALILFSVVIFIITMIQSANYIYPTSVYEVLLIGRISSADIAASLNFLVLPFFISYIGISVINEDQVNGFAETMVVRGKKFTDYRKKSTVSALITGGIVAIFPTVFNFVTISLIYQSYSIDLFNVPYDWYIFSKLIYRSPMLFFVLNIAILYFFGVGTVALSLIIKYVMKPRYRLEIVIPFIIHMILLFSSSIIYTLSFHEYLYYLFSIFSSYEGIVFFIILPVFIFGGVYIVRKNKDYI